LKEREREREDKNIHWKKKLPTKSPLSASKSP
jgi:hypothetical protein